ncbi:MAG: thioredoxin-disulfide reductase [Desulfotomaculales bacterium]
MDKEIVIIGGGPAGLAAGIYAVRASRDVVLYERGIPGGKVTETERIENYPGFPGGIGGPELMMRMEEHARGLGLKIESNEILEINREDGIFVLRSRMGDIRTKTVILATGTGPRPLGVEGESRLRGRGVSYCAVCDGAFFRDQEVAVVGGGDAAVEEAQFLTRFASKVYLIHRRGELRAARSIQEQALKNPRIEPIWHAVVEEIRGENAVEEVVIKDVRDGALRTLPVNGIFIYVGTSPNSYLVEKLVERDERGFIITDEEMRTSVPGLFAAGDIRKKPLRQIVTAVADGAIAAISADRYLARGK